MELFNIPKECTPLLKISNENGYIFEPKLFEYFILLFPRPEITFYLRLDYASNKVSTSKDERPYPFGYSKLNTKRQRYIDEVRRYGAPVRRQNCFIGSLPEPSPTFEEDYNAQEVITQIAKRRRYNETGLGAATKVTRKNTSKRSIRL